VLTGQEAQDSSYNLELSAFYYPKSTGKLVNPKSSRHMSLLESPSDILTEAPNIQPRLSTGTIGVVQRMSIFYGDANDLGPLSSTYRTRSTRFGFHTSRVNTPTVVVGISQSLKRGYI